MSVIFISGCASLQTEKLLLTRNEYPQYIELSDVPFFAQQQYQCGPAALAMVLQAENIYVTPDELTSKIFLPNRKGSLQIEILATARQYDVIPYVLNKNMLDLFAEVQANHPVLILQNLGLSWLPRWHYAVVIGFDFTTSEMILRSGIEVRHRVPMKVFERTWARADYWAVVMLAPDTLPATVEANRYLQAVASLERMNKFNISKTAYRTALTKWPGNLAALMGMGNSYAALEDYASAEYYFREATLQHPQAADAFNNLADTLLHVYRYTEALAAIRVAVALGGKHTEIYLNTLQSIEAKLEVR